MDLSHYADVIKKLTTLYYEPDFSSLFEQLTEGESKSTRFLIKMEVKRLSTPTRRILDFRQRTTSGVIPYEYDGILHHMMPTAIKLLETLLVQHQGHYTLGVYEEVLAYQVSERSKSVAERDVVTLDPAAAFAVEPVQYASYFIRNEERMHYSSGIKMRIGERFVDAMTSDISTSGIKVKVGKNSDIAVGSLVNVNFSSLRQEYANHFLRDFFAYKLMGIDEEEKFDYLRLMRIDDSTELDTFITTLITQNKSKYKVNVRYQEENVVVKGYEQFFLPRMSGLPLYVSNADKPVLSHLLLNENNRGVYDYWVNEESKSQLEACWQSPWMQTLMQANARIETTIYSFYYTQNGHIYFYAADAQSLAKSGSKALFLAFACQRPNFRVFKLSLNPTVFDEKKHLLEVENQHQALGTQTLAALQDIRWVGLLQDITNENVLNDYKAYAQQGSDFNQLHQYRLPVAEQRAQLSQFKYVQLRKESRFSYKTAIVANDTELSIKGWSNDFSTEGLQVELETPMDVQIGQRIYLELPMLQKLSKKVALANLPYSVVGCNKAKTVLHLQIVGDKATHIGCQFFNLLISSNKDKLKSMPEPSQSPGVTAVLRNMYCHHLATMPLYIHKVNTSYQIDRIGISQCENSLLPLFECFGQAETPYNLYPLLGDNSIRHTLDEALEGLESTYRPWQQVLYITIASSDSAVETRFEKDFDDEHERRQFVSHSLQKGAFFAIQVMLSRTGRPDMEFIEKELNYVSHYAIHRAQKLEDELWRVRGVVDLIDVSEELLYRLGLRRTS
ncbi:PilZ domain-containing protein [Moritella marina ATCC 15381]|uniref:PilZ domain-containing protein n=1 Tax=Moritella marina ATCC 15381 TaxID=1202962 RepID=A0A5J6WT42_MORMI|nr:PilZ domain-containing protein [Moritella marina]QFI40115.1 PilZ domain-containing protein [Moritella marina ATCC 15381]